MKVLVTGGTGFVGSHAVRALLAAGHEPRLLARSQEKVERVLTGRGVPIRDVVLGDVENASAVSRALDGCDAVLHTAATVAVGGGPGATKAASQIGSAGAGVRNVLGMAAERGLDPIVHVSSVVALYPPAGPRCRVDDPVGNPRTAYSRAKAEAERYARALQTEGCPVVIIYPPGVYGPGDPGLGDVAKGLRDRLRYGWPIPPAGGTACVDVRDLAWVLAQVIERGRGPRRYMAGGHFMTWAEEADLVEAMIGRRVRRVRAPRRVMLGVGRIVEGLQRLIPSFDYPLTYEAADILSGTVPCDSEATVAELGVDFRPAEETLRDSIAWLIASGHMDARYAPKLAVPARS